MSRVYDNWERLVAATLKRELLREIALCPSLSSSSSIDTRSSFDSLDQALVNGQIDWQELESNESNSLLPSSVPSIASDRSLGHSRQGHTEAMMRNGNRTKDRYFRTENEWVEQDEPGVYITLTSLPGGLKDLKRIRFSRKRFSEKQAEQWWAENRARVYELYNVRMVDKSSVGLKEMAERLPVGSARNIKFPPLTSLVPPSLSNDISNASVDQVNGQIDGQELESNESNSLLPSSVPGIASDRNLGPNSQGHTEAMMRNGNRTKDSDFRTENEWVEQDEPGVYITLTSLPGGLKDLKRVRFSRKRFSKKQAEQWWVENRARVYVLYNIRMVDKSSVVSSFSRLDYYALSIFS